MKRFAKKKKAFSPRQNAENEDQKNIGKQVTREFVYFGFQSGVLQVLLLKSSCDITNWAEPISLYQY